MKIFLKIGLFITLLIPAFMAFIIGELVVFWWKIEEIVD